ncbi:hypothetical protein AB0A60_32490 [Streptomyces sp. NPDC046275]|uniref:hypothetical protein n=1 Tax=Streptomyces sp. NPDC046275 TaxID=3157201 RepID=UPI0033EAAC86
MKPRFTFEEHVEMGQALSSIRDDLLHRSVTLANAYPRSGPEGVPEKKLEQAYKAIDQARSALDSLLAQEHPREFEPTVYYPHTEDQGRRA